MCLLHEDYHPMTDACWGAVVQHSFEHPGPFTEAAYDDYQLRVEQALLDRHIRQHLGLQEAPVPAYDPDGDPMPVPQDDDLEQAA
jgi:hypothetical protein